MKKKQVYKVSVYENKFCANKEVFKKKPTDNTLKLVEAFYETFNYNLFIELVQRFKQYF